MQQSSFKQINKKENNAAKHKKQIKQQKKEEEDNDKIILNDNWGDELVDNHFFDYKNIDKINLLEIN